jgi:hypothetical protein
MTQDQGQLRQPPAIDASAAVQRQLLEAERRLLEARLRAAWLTASGEALGPYQQLQDRRREVLSALAGERERGQETGSFPAPGGHVSARPIAAPVFDPGTGVFGFGSSGVVQLAPAAVGGGLVPPAPCIGAIDTVAGTAIGEVAFGGELSSEIEDEQPLPASTSFWLQTWHYLVPFPPPPVLSVFSYSFEVYALDQIYASAGPGRQVLSFVSLGETPSLFTGEVISVNVDAGWPLDADLTQPGPEYNGFDGLVRGQLSVQRSFLVPAYQVPGVAIVVGAVAALSPGSSVDLAIPDWGIYGESFISLGTGEGGIGRATGTVSYTYEPRLVVAQ